MHKCNIWQISIELPYKNNQREAQTRSHNKTAGSWANSTLSSKNLKLHSWLVEHVAPYLKVKENQVLKSCQIEFLNEFFDHIQSNLFIFFFIATALVDVVSEHFFQKMGLLTNCQRPFSTWISGASVPCEISERRSWGLDQVRICISNVKELKRRNLRNSFRIKLMQKSFLVVTGKLWTFFTIYIYIFLSHFQPLKNVPHLNAGFNDSG